MPFLLALIVVVGSWYRKTARSVWASADRSVSLMTSPARLLIVDPDLGCTPLRWLETGPTTSSPTAVKIELAKLAYLRKLDAHPLDLSMLPAERRRFLANLGRRLTGQALARREAERRYPILLALSAESAVDVLDEVVFLFD
jgi:hypothetical protein